MVYKRAKQSVDELHRARKFEKSIKIWSGAKHIKNTMGTNNKL